MLWSYSQCKRLCLRYNGLPDDDQGRLTTQEEDIYDLEYMLPEDLLNQDPPAVRYAKSYVTEQQEIKRKRKRKLESMK